MNAIDWWESLTLDNQLWMLKSYPVKTENCDTAETIKTIHERHQILEDTP